MAASEALRVGQSQRAAEYAEALTERDADDITAHLIRSRALRDLGQIPEARQAARTAWSLADTKDERYSSALVMAQALSSGGQRTRAQLWLRRAIQAAPNESLSKKAIRDFKYVRATNPWSTRLTFSVTPDSNFNNGSSNRSPYRDYRFIWLDTGEPLEVIPDKSARALSGVEYAFANDTRYRFWETETRAHDLTIAVDLRLYSLSSDAKQIAPDKTGSDFSFYSLGLGYAHRGLNFDRKGEYRLTTEAGQSWYGGAGYTRFLRLSAGQDYATSRTNKIGSRLSFERQFGLRTHDLDTLRTDLTFGTRLKNGTRLNLVLTGAAATSPVQTQEFDELGLRAQLGLAKPVIGANVFFGLGVRSRRYDVSRYSLDGRQDLRTNADVTFVFSKLDYYGFNPTMTLSASQNESNISLFDSNRIGVNFGFQSAF